MQHNAKQTISYKFVEYIKLQYGMALFLIGDIQQLGCWKIQNAIRMKYYQNIWIHQTQIPLDVKIEYKYFIGSYENYLHSNIKWISHKNTQLFIQNQRKKYYLPQDSLSLSLMSFNIRFQNPKDKNQYAWINRRENCARKIIQVFPDLLGVQELKCNQKQYLLQKIGHLYKYFGKPRDLKADEGSGIFLRKDKFKVIQDGYIWINQNKQQGKKGFEARLPRYFTFLILKRLTDNYQLQKSLIMVCNTHLDHQSFLARKKGIEYISETLVEKKKQYSPFLMDFFVTGDFNTSQNDEIFQCLKLEDAMLQSMRVILPTEKVNFSLTFNNFKPQNNTFQVKQAATIDHIFVKNKTYRSESFEVIFSQQILSDHNPIIGRFTINN